MKVCKEIIKKQLGRKKIHDCTTVQKCSYGYPVVCRFNPTKNSVISKTLYWLTCPYLRKKLGNLEERSFINDTSEYIQNNFSVYQKFTEMYRNERINACEKAGLKISEDIKNAGISGVEDIRYAKCLHAHMAYYMVNKEYNVGKFIVKSLERLECTSENVICANFKGGRE